LGQRIFDTGRDLREAFSIDYSLGLQLLQRVGEGFWADSVQLFQQFVESEFSSVAEDVDDEERPFLAYDVYDAFDGAEA
jgi:hypothetical protein